MVTIKKGFKVKSLGLMSGIESEAEVLPARNKGIRFYFGGKSVEAKLENVVSTEHCTVIGADGIKIVLIEHFMAACALTGIDSLEIHLSHYELPILDGGSKMWVDKFNEAGIDGEDNRVIKLKEPVYYLNGKTHLVALPSNELNLTYSVNYKHKDLQNRWVSLDTNNLDEIAQARTFGYLSELEMLQKAGYGRGVSLENTLGLKDNGTYTSELKSEFEPIKHKILDLIGDFYLIGCNVLKLKAAILVKEAGHSVHVNFAKELKDKIIVEE